jgi:hypothetical protein
MSVPHRFPQGYDIWNHVFALELKSPPVLPNPTETNLNLVSDANSASRPNMTADTT